MMETDTLNPEKNELEQNDTLGDEAINTKNKKSLLRTVGFYTWNYFVDTYWAYILYFVITSLLGALILWGIEGKNISFIDAYFTATSSVCVTGLQAVDTHALNTGTQTWMLILMLIGGEVFCSTYPLFICLFSELRNRNKEIAGDAPPKIKEMRKYRVQCLVILILSAFIYWFLMQATAIAILMVYNVFSEKNRSIYYSHGVNPFFGTIFISIASFNNAGFAPFSNNLVPFANSWLPLVVWGILIVGGNTGYPVFFRMGITLLNLMLPRFRPVQMLLKYSRIYYTHLFPLKTTFMVLLILFAFAESQAIVTYIFDWNFTLATEGQNGFYKLLDGLFQSLATRTCGSNVIPIANSRPPVLVMYLVMMYIANYPVNVALRGTETRLVEQANQRYGTYSKRSAIRDIALNDMFIVGLFFFIISICEVNLKLNNPHSVNLFGILFEVVSAYGTVGLSLGFNNDTTSLSGRFNVTAKVFMIFLMIIGRCRRISNKYDTAVWAHTFWNKEFWKEDSYKLNKSFRVF